VGKQAQVTVASESVHETNCSLQGLGNPLPGLGSLGIHAHQTPPTIARPRHQLSLGSFHRQPIATSTPSAIPCVKLSLERPRHTKSGVTGALLQYIKDKTTPLTMPL